MFSFRAESNSWCRNDWIDWILMCTVSDSVRDPPLTSRTGLIPVTVIVPITSYMSFWSETICWLIWESANCMWIKVRVNCVMSVLCHIEILVELVSITMFLLSFTFQPSVPEQLPGGGPPGCGPTRPSPGGDETGPSPGLRLCGRQWETGGGPLCHTR